MRGMLSLLGTPLLVSLTALVPSAMTAQVPTAPATQPSASKKVALAKDYGKLPLTFEANRGQTDPQVRFLSRGNGYSLFLTDRAAVLSLRRPDGASAAKASLPSRLEPKRFVSFKTDVVRMELAGASRNLHVTGDSQLPGMANYFIGNDPAKWHSAVPTYARVKYDHVYPGVDLVYYGNQQQLEYDFVVAPHADPKAIKLRFAGASKLKINADGDLEVIAKNGQIAFHKPVIYQQIAGKRQYVEGSFSLLASNSIALTLGTYDNNKEIVIDPTLSYSTYLGGSTGDFATSIAVDGSGYSYVTGMTSDDNFPTTSGVYEQTSASTAQLIFVSKFNATATSLIYSTYFGGQADGSEPGNSVYGIAIDSGGNVYLTGNTTSATFPVTSGAYQTTFGGSQNGNAFVTKLNPTGSALVYSTYLGGSKSASYVPGDEGNGIAVDSSGNAYIAGDTTSSDFPAKGAYQGTLGSPYGNAFVSKMNSSGTALVYSTYLGGSRADPGFTASDMANAIAVDASGDAYVAGLTYSTNFPVTSGAYQTTNNVATDGGSNAFVSKLTSVGDSLAFSTYLGGSGSPGGTNSGIVDVANAISVDESAQVYVAGTTVSTNFPVSAGAFQSTNNDQGGDSGNAFVSEFNASGSSLLYSTYLGGADELGAVASGVAVTAPGEVFITGSTNSTNFPTTANAYQSTNHASTGTSNFTNAFLAKINTGANGKSSLIYATYLGGSGDGNGNGDSANAIAADTSGNIYIAGVTNSSDFPTTPGSFQTKNNTYGNGIGSANSSNAFVSKFGFGSTTTLATTTSLTSDGSPQNSGTKVTFTASVQPATGSGVPTGTVTFTIDGTPGSPVALDSTGHATYATASLSAGSHTITANYSGDTTYSASTSSSLTEIVVGPAASISVVSGSAQSASYGSSFTSPLVVLVKDANGNPVSGVTATFSGTGLSFSSSTVTTGSSGEASVTATAKAAGRLTASAAVSGASTPATFPLTATKVPLTITATNASVAYNQAIPALTYSVSGFVNGDTSSVLAGTPSETTTATKGSPVGTYLITIAQGSLTAANYSFTFVNGTLTVVGGTVSLSPASVAFSGTTKIGSTSGYVVVTMQNTGNASVTGIAFSITGANASSFFLPSGHQLCTSTLAAGASCTFDVAFKPTTSGALSASVQIADSATNTPQTVALTGTGVTAVTASVNPTSIAFASTTVGSTSAYISATLTNNGTSALTGIAFSLAGANASSFFLPSTHQNCTATLAAGASCTFDAAFKPTVGGALTASVQIADSASNSPQTVALSGTGTVATTASVSPTSIAFANTRVGSTSAYIMATLTNNGSAAMTGISFSITGTNASSFFLPSTHQTCTATLAAGASCTFDAAFKPTVGGALTASVQIADSASNSPQTVALTGTGVTAVTASVSPTSIAFATTPVGSTSAYMSVTLTNNGTSSLTGVAFSVAGTNASSFFLPSTHQTCTATLAAGASCTFDVAFKPTVTGTLTGSVQITDSATNSPQTVALSGAGK